MIKKNYSITLSNNKTTLNFYKYNERIIVLNPVHSDYEIKNPDGVIIDLNYDDCFNLTLDNLLILKKDKYKIKKITREDTKGFLGEGYYLYTHTSVTKSSTFIMPFLGGVKEDYRYSKEFVNCFIGLENLGDYGNNIYLLYRFSGNAEFTKFEDDLRSHPLYEDTIEVDKFQTMYSFKVPDNRKEDIQKIIDGKYSRISSDAKERILTFNNFTIDSDLGKILTKHPEKKLKLEQKIGSELHPDAELYSVFYTEEEIFMNNNIIN